MFFWLKVNVLRQHFVFHVLVLDVLMLWSVMIVASGGGGGPRSPRSPTQRSISVSSHPSELPHRDVGLSPMLMSSNNTQYIGTTQTLLSHLKWIQTLQALFLYIY